MLAEREPALVHGATPCPCPLWPGAFLLPISFVVVLSGVSLLALRGSKNLFDIEFLGGVAAEFELKQAGLEPIKMHIREALSLGYQSVMVDGSRLPLDENIACTRAAVDLAHASDVPCEAELGMIMGHESGPLPPYEELFRSGRGFTRPDEAARFVKESGCDWLSVAIGNIHGAVGDATKNQKKLEARL
jgi:hypothetical protein